MYDTRHGTLLAQPENASLGLALNCPNSKVIAAWMLCST
jgi:acyl-homoserine-lactone acylase